MVELALILLSFFPLKKVKNKKNSENRYLYSGEKGVGDLKETLEFLKKKKIEERRRS